MKTKSLECNKKQKKITATTTWTVETILQCSYFLNKRINLCIFSIFLISYFLLKEMEGNLISWRWQNMEMYNRRLVSQEENDGPKYLREICWHGLSDIIQHCILYRMSCVCIVDRLWEIRSNKRKEKKKSEISVWLNVSWFVYHLFENDLFVC